MGTYIWSNQGEEAVEIVDVESHAKLKVPVELAVDKYDNLLAEDVLAGEGDLFDGNADEWDIKQNTRVSWLQF